MPKFDATGPWGMGPGTGWGRGPCGTGLRRGFGRGRGGGLGPGGRPSALRPWGPPRWGFGPWWFGATEAGRAAAYGSPRDEAAVLKVEEAHLREELEAIQKRLAGLESS